MHLRSFRWGDDKPEHQISVSVGNAQPFIDIDEEKGTVNACASGEMTVPEAREFAKAISLAADIAEGKINLHPAWKNK